MPVVWILIIALWTPGEDHPTRVGHASYDTISDCDHAAAAIDADWISKVKGGSSSWACFGAYPAPTT